jgi:hypothetical protein
MAGLMNLRRPGVKQDRAPGFNRGPPGPTCRPEPFSAEGETMRFACLTPFLFLALSACGTAGSHVAEEAQQKLVGMRTDDLQACAGIPTRTKQLEDGTELLSYEQKNGNIGGVNIALPLVGGFNLAGSGSYCHALFRVAEGRVIGLNYTGDNDDRGGENGVCAPIVRGCLRQPVPARAPAPAPAISMEPVGR